MCQAIDVNLEVSQELRDDLEREVDDDDREIDDDVVEEEEVNVDEEEEDYFKDVETIRAKWSMDGATTLDEAIEKLHEFIEVLRQYKRDGFELIETINDDYGFLKQRGGSRS
jgi:hypothetical protein